MKGIGVGMVAMVLGMVMVISFSMVFEYASVHRNLSFALKNGMYQSAKVAIVPELECEIVFNSAYDPLLPELEEEYVEECVAVYMEEEEYFDVLLEGVASYHQPSYPVRLSLMAYQNNPFLSRVEASTTIQSSFLRVKVVVEEMMIQNEE